MQHIVPVTNRMSNATTKFFEPRDRKIQTGTGNAPKIPIPKNPMISATGNAAKSIVSKTGSGNENKFPCMYKSCERKGKIILKNILECFPVKVLANFLIIFFSSLCRNWFCYQGFSR